MAGLEPAPPNPSVRYLNLAQLLYGASVAYARKRLEEYDHVLRGALSLSYISRRDASLLSPRRDLNGF